MNYKNLKLNTPPPLGWGLPLPLGSGNKRKTMALKISEIFYSLQGEGSRAGEPSVFIRLAGCKAKHACWQLGIKCDTEFESGVDYTLEDIHTLIKKLTDTCKWIVWTGGEPTDQLTDSVVSYFKDLGYFQAVETSGLNPLPKGLDYITISPKVAEHVLLKVHGDIIVDELRYVRHIGQSVPEPSLKAKYYYLSPHSSGSFIDTENLIHCIDLCKQFPKWRLSIQQHKLWKIL